MAGCEEFLRILSEKTNYLIYETPINHTRMHVPTDQIEKKLKEYFKSVGLKYIYDAYSSGERAIFICHNYKVRN